MNMNQLDHGIRWWLANWPTANDFLNTFYVALYLDRPDGALTEQWWAQVVTRLSQWRATRGGRITRAIVQDRGKERLAQLSDCYWAIRGTHDAEPTIDDVTWEQIAALFQICREIKPCRSPMFASKLCHFMFPKVFFVVDNMATGIFEYEYVWRGLKESWHACAEQAPLVDLLSNRIRKTGQEVHAQYPFETKLPELCLIGQMHGV